MPINWKDPEVKDRLLAAIIASFDGNINCKEVARIFGDGATYSAIENFLRKPKKEAQQMKAKAAGVATPASSPRKPKTPTKPKTPVNGVKSGRVTKNKKAGGTRVKREIESDDEESINLSGTGPEDDVTDEDDAEGELDGEMDSEYV